MRVLEQAQDITYRLATHGQEGEEEWVFALRTDPLRLEMFCHHSRDEMRLHWQAPWQPKSLIARPGMTGVHCGTACACRLGRTCRVGLEDLYSVPEGRTQADGPRARTQCRADPRTTIRG